VRTQLTAAKGYAVETIYHVRVTATAGGLSGSKTIGLFLIVSADVLRVGDIPAWVGAGARAVTITVDDGTDPLESVKVRVTKGAESYVQETNASGVAPFNLDDGSWVVSLTLSGYTYAGTTLVVDGTETPTYSMTQVTFPASDPGMVTGYLYCYDEDGVAEQSVAIDLQFHALSGSGVAGDTATRSASSDVTGLVTFGNLFVGATYRLRRGASGNWKHVTIPTNATSPHALPDVWGSD